jgi:hypothetical protein
MYELDSKPVWASKSVWGSLMVLVVAIGHIAGVDLGDAGQWADDVVLILGAGIGIYGRVKAVKKIK